MKRMALLLPVIAAVSCLAFVWQTVPGKKAEPKDASNTFTTGHWGQSSAKRPQSRNILLALPYRHIPFTLDIMSMSLPRHDGFLPEDVAISDLINLNRGAFSRNPMLNYEFVAKLHISPNHDLIVMRSQNFSGGDMYPVHYSICTMDSTGKICGKTNNIASLRSPLELRTAVISAESIVCHSIEQTWEKDPLIAGYNDNKVIKSTVEDTAVYKMNKDGQYEEVD